VLGGDLQVGLLAQVAHVLEQRIVDLNV